MLLTREYRSWIDDDAAQPFVERNSWSGTQGDRVGGSFATYRVSVSGEPDKQTGYICDIRELDALLRQFFCERSAFRRGTSITQIAQNLMRALESAEKAVPKATTLESVELALSPYTMLSTKPGRPAMVKLSQMFEFSASHRLAIPSLSDDENLRRFGKCSNPHGHGHNYVLEISVTGEVESSEGRLVDLAQLDRVVQQRVIEPFDHKNLNVETTEFSDLNPTVENIARVIFQRLQGQFDGAELDSVRVWETPKTSATVTCADI